MNDDHRNFGQIRGSGNVLQLNCTHVFRTSVQNHVQPPFYILIQLQKSISLFTGMFEISNYISDISNSKSVARFSGWVSLHSSFGATGANVFIQGAITTSSTRTTLILPSQTKSVNDSRRFENSRNIDLNQSIKSQSPRERNISSKSSRSSSPKNRSFGSIEGDMLATYNNTEREIQTINMRVDKILTRQTSVSRPNKRLFCDTNEIQFSEVKSQLPPQQRKRSPKAPKLPRCALPENNKRPEVKQQEFSFKPQTNWKKSSSNRPVQRQKPKPKVEKSSSDDEKPIQQQQQQQKEPVKVEEKKEEINNNAAENEKPKVEEKKPEEVKQEEKKPEDVKKKSSDSSSSDSSSIDVDDDKKEDKKEEEKKKKSSDSSSDSSSIDIDTNKKEDKKEEEKKPEEEKPKEKSDSSSDSSSSSSSSIDIDDDKKEETKEESTIKISSSSSSGDFSALMNSSKASSPTKEKVTDAPAKKDDKKEEKKESDSSKKEEKKKEGKKKKDNSSDDGGILSSSSSSGFF